MSNIGLLTYHHVINAGSVLQTLCAYRLLQGLFPYKNIEIIDYYPEASQRYNSNLSNPILQSAMIELLHRECRFSPYKIRSDESTAAAQAIRARGYDFIFTGSDTVFQTNGYLGRLIAGPAAPNLYYLAGDLGARKFGLSVSFDPPQEINAALAKRLGDLLQQFSFVFYRDSHAEATLESLGLQRDKMAFLPDPTVMVDFDSLVPRLTLDSDKGSPFVGVSISNPKLRHAAARFAESRGYRVVDLMHPPEIASVRRSGLLRRKAAIRLLDRLAVYRRLSGLISDRFHGSLFAMQLGNCPVVGIEFSGNYPARHGKLWDLNERLQRSQTIIRSDGEDIHESALEDAWEVACTLPLDTKARLALLRAQGFQSLEGVRTAGHFQA